MNKSNISIKELIGLADNAIYNNDLKVAKFYLEKIILLDNKLYQIHNSLGIINLKLKDFENSIINFKDAILLNDKYSTAFSNLGYTYEILKNKKQALVQYLKAVEIDPKNYKAYFNLGNLLRSQDKLEDAEKYYLLAIEVKPNLIFLYNNLFELYDRSNQHAKFESILNRAKSIFSPNTLIDFFSGIFEFRKKNYQEVIKIFENIKLDKSDNLKIAFKNNMLAKSYDFLGDYERAYSLFETSNQNITDIYEEKVNKSIYLESIIKRIDYFSKQKKINWNNFSKIDQKNDPIFMVGFPRSGTTLLDTILRTHKKISVIEEKPLVNNFIDELEKKINGNFSNLIDIDNDFYHQLRNKYFDQRNLYIKENINEILIDKLPLNIIYVAEIYRFFPKAKFIFALRNPYDVVLSCFMQPFPLNNAMANLTNLEDATYLYNKVMELWSLYAEKLNINFHEIKYEDTVLNFKDTIKDLLEFLDLDWSDDLNEFYKTALNRGLINTPSYNQVNSPLYKTAIDRWKNYENKFHYFKHNLDKWVIKFRY